MTTSAERRTPATVAPRPPLVPASLTDRAPLRWLATTAVDRVPTVRAIAPHVGVAAGGLVLALVLPDSPTGRGLLAFVLAVALASFTARFPRVAITVVLVWLAAVGTTRRVVSMFQADPRSDPLLLVGPAAVVVLVAHAAVRMPRPAWPRRGPRWASDGLVLAVVAFSAVALLSVLNPANPSLASGAQGLLFWLVPLLWFWAGRALLDRASWERLVQLFAVICALASAYGLFQAVAGFPPWDQQWIEARGYRALEVNGPETLRSFSVFASASEYALAASMALVLCLLLAVRAFRRESLPLAGLWFVLAGIGAAALTFSAVRTAVVLAAIALGTVFMASRGWRLGRIVAVGAVALVLTVAVANRIDVTKMHDQGLSGMVRRTVRGIGNPFDDKKSTFGSHVELTRRALDLATEHPVGSGTSAATIAGDRAGAPTGGGENDLANALLAFGFPGAVLVLGTIACGFATAMASVRRHRTLASLAAIGLLVLQLRFWWGGFHYFASAAVWLALGWAVADADGDATGDLSAVAPRTEAVA